jgi:hypothetical protein
MSTESDVLEAPSFLALNSPGGSEITTFEFLMPPRAAGVISKSMLPFPPMGTSML